ncbi:FprA family A-type flavoprotein, partial [Myxococcota bacterium]|nr:FprA family A-type flavoprotein [Myxococcota bacterium]
MQQRAHTAEPDLAHAIELGDRLYWVGHLLEGDPFQCHVYLIENGTDSVLIDPGSMLTFPHVRRKVEEIIPWEHVRYFVCQHPDPDIVGALPHIDAINTRDDAVIVTHWRAAALLHHLAVKMPFWKIEEHGWALDVGARKIRFVLTPYLHFPGAFATFDEETGTLFSSDLFGGFTPEPRLFAKDESYFEDIRAFHEHYMPSHDILAHGILRLRELPIEQIAPQHGSVIRGHLVPFIMDRLMSLDCGLYLLARQDTEIRRLLKLNSLLRDLMHALVVYQDFRSVALFLLEQARAVLPVEGVEFWARRGQEKALSFSPSTRYRGVEEAAPPRAEIAKHLERPPSVDAPTHHEVVLEADGTRILVVPLVASDDPELRAVAVL